MSTILPSDSWLEGGVAFIVFDLRSASDGPEVALGVAQAIFALDAASGGILAVRVLEPCTGAAPPQIDDLLARGDAA